MALDDSIEVRRLNVDTNGTVVTVRGSVDTRAQRERALQLARETDGVTSVVDRIDVAGH
jgi:osmotically-inducible protein OsmY